MTKITNPADGEFTLPVGSHPERAIRDVTAPPRYVDQPGPQVVRDGREPERPFADPAVVTLRGAREG